MNYKDSGVDVDLAENLVEEYLTDFSSQIGKFAASMDTPIRSHSSDLVVSVDGVGTKTILAKQYKELTNAPLSNIGKDCVAMVMNDILCEYARPIMFMDYFATNKLVKTDFLEVLTGMREYCLQMRIPILGGETAEMPGMFARDAFDVCGFGAGIKWEKFVDIKEGDLVIGYESNGVHSNGFSLIRKIIEDNYGGLMNFISEVPGMASDLLKPTKLYYENVFALFKLGLDVGGLAHITGGGWKNINRVIPNGFSVEWNLKEKYYSNQHIFEWIQEQSKLSDEEMKNTFNCGIGMMAIIQGYKAEELMGEFTVLGEIKKS